MATVVIMPRQGQSVESCIITEWKKQKGDSVKTGDVLFTYETDKASFEEEASVDGTLLEIFYQEVDDVPVLTNVCVIGNPGENVDEFNPNKSISPEQSEPPPVEASIDNNETIVNDTVQTITENTITSEIIKISPRAKGLAEKAGVDFRYASPSGPYGRIIEKDIIDLKENGPKVTSSAKSEYMKLDNAQNIIGTGIGGRVTTQDLSTPSAEKESLIVEEAVNKPEYEEVKLTNIRKVIAKAMYNSISTTCQLTLNSSFDATDILNYRKKLKSIQDKLGLENITLNDIVLFAVSRTLLNYKDLNAHFLDDKMLYFTNVNLGVAIDTERGLMVPNIFRANLKSLNQISSEVKKVAVQCQNGTVSPDVLKGGSFTVTNLGSLGIESFTPVLNAPQTGILGVGNIVYRAKEVNGEFKNYPAMGLSLTFDHRALDGAPAAKFLKELVTNLENFSVLLAK